MDLHFKEQYWRRSGVGRFKRIKKGCRTVKKGVGRLSDGCRSAVGRYRPTLSVGTVWQCRTAVGRFFGKSTDIFLSVHPPVRSLSHAQRKVTPILIDNIQMFPVSCILETGKLGNWRTGSKWMDSFSHRVFSTYMPVSGNGSIFFFTKAVFENYTKFC